MPPAQASELGTPPGDTEAGEGGMEKKEPFFRNKNLKTKTGLKMGSLRAFF